MKTFLQRAVFTAIVFASGAVALTQLPFLRMVSGQDPSFQPPREGGPPPFGAPRGPMRGGFGGPMGPGAMPRSNVALLATPEVQAELALTSAQKERVAELEEEMHEQLRSMFSGVDFEESGSLSEDELDKRFAGMRTKTEAAMKRLDEKLNKDLDAKQVERLNQLALQRDVIAALNRPDVVKQLHLTKDQVVKLREMAGRGLPPFASPDVRQQSQTDAIAVLNDTQKKKWSDLTGKSFTFSERQFGGPGGRGPGGPMGEERKVVAQFDKDADGRLNRDERTAAREFMKTNRGGGPGRPRGMGRSSEPAKPGPSLSPNDVKPVVDVSLYEPTVLRTLFLEFEDADWEAELTDFYNTDVEVPAKVTVDGISYANVGIHFRGMSSFMGVAPGSKRSLNLSFDYVDSKQRLYGYKTLNLLNSHEDPTFLHSVLYSHIARKYIPAPKANFVKLVINGESWGVYTNAQQFNKEFLAENYPSSKGARWKVRGSPGGRGGLEYFGDNIDEYKKIFTLKTNDSDDDWRALIKLCKTLNETPLDQLEEALSPMLDIDEVLWFLALDNALINCDGYWIRASDYAIFRDAEGVFHIIPHDMNEAFQPPMGPGMGGMGGIFAGGPGGGSGPSRRGPGGGPDRREPGSGRPSAEGRPGAEGRRPGAGGNVDLDPLVGLTDMSKPLRSRLLAVPSLKAKYLAHVKQIAEESLDWKALGPLVAQYEELIGKEIKADTKKLTSYAAFQQTVSGTATHQGEQRGRPHMGLKQFADQRREFLLSYPEIKSLEATTSRSR